MKKNKVTKFICLKQKTAEVRTQLRGHRTTNCILIIHHTLQLKIHRDESMWQQLEHKEQRRKSNLSFKIQN